LLQKKRRFFQANFFSDETHESTGGTQPSLVQGGQIFLEKYNIRNWEKASNGPEIYQMVVNIPNDH
jgi:hypothetical protein